MKIIATETKAHKLKAGDLFSGQGQTYWDRFADREAIGEKVYLRTDVKCPENQEQVDIYKIEVVE